MKKRVSKKLVLVGLAVALTLAVGSVASAQPGEFVKGVLQPLADGFPNRKITLVVVDDPGTRDDIYAKTLQEGLRSISPVPIIVSDEPVARGGTFHKMKDVTRRDGGTEGYYIVMTDAWGAGTDPLSEPIKEELGMDLTDLNMVTVTECMTYLFYQRKNAPWGPTFAGLVKYGKANPGKLVNSMGSFGSGGDINVSWIMSKAGVTDYKKVPLGSKSKSLAAIGAGEADFDIGGAGKTFAAWKDGRVDVILSTACSVPPPFDKDPNVVTLEGAGLGRVKLGNHMGWSVPRQVPKAHVDWLFKLFKAGASTDVHQKRAKVIPGLEFGILNPAEANALKRQLNEMADPIIRQMGIHVDQQKKK
jgi:tripartite-type tricarboxylate transporter receptor subunit TctC